jgi:Flp pilus assembly protein protease CpaA
VALSIPESLGKQLEFPGGVSLHRPFFPDPAFGWGFYAMVVAIAGVAAYTDLRTRTVPKWLTVTAFFLGLVLNIARGGWLGCRGEQVWLLAPGPWLGGLDACLFGLAGAGVGFGVFFLLWALGTCGGGDLKLFTALGAWVGPKYIIWVFAGTLPVLLVLIVTKVLLGGWTPHAIRKTLKEDRSRSKKRFQVTYSLPVAVVTAVILLWFFRVDLHLAAPTHPATMEVTAHAR